MRLHTKDHAMWIKHIVPLGLTSTFNSDALVHEALSLVPQVLLSTISIYARAYMKLQLHTKTMRSHGIWISTLQSFISYMLQSTTISHLVNHLIELFTSLHAII